MWRRRVQYGFLYWNLFHHHLRNMYVQWPPAVLGTSDGSE
ncbi:hypothetical protein C5167_026020 [Papaver somniferum]|nr:hypothetical protein C5167_026020 [Papaver somniferum]